MQYRQFGNTGIKVSVVGFGGIIVLGMAQDAADRAVGNAIDCGVNYFDFAPSYGDCQERLGPALRAKRSQVILACKTGARTKNEADKELSRSLELLETDHFDVYQLHAIPDLDALEEILAPGGAVETLIEARERGLTRFIGFTTHKTEVALEAMNRCAFDTVLFPVNFAYWLNDGAGAEVLEEAARRGMGRAAIKAMAHRAWAEGADRRWGKCWYEPLDDPRLAELAVRFTLSQDINVMLPPGHLELFEMAVKASDRFMPLQPDEMDELKSIALGVESIFTG